MCERAAVAELTPLKVICVWKMISKAIIITLMYFYFSEGRYSNLIDILTVNATDLDSEENNKIRFSLRNTSNVFSIGEHDGILKANTTNIGTGHKQDFQLTVLATDSGKPPLHSAVSVRVKVNSQSTFGGSPNKKDYR